MEDELFLTLTFAYRRAAYLSQTQPRCGLHISARGMEPVCRGRPRWNVLVMLFRSSTPSIGPDDRCGWRRGYITPAPLASVRKLTVRSSRPSSNPGRT